MTTIGKSLFRGKSSDSGGGSTSAGNSSGSILEEYGLDPSSLPEKLRGLDERFIANILSEIVDHGAPVTWDDIGVWISAGITDSGSVAREAEHFGGGGVADAAAGAVHGASFGSPRVAAVRSAGNGENAAGEGDRARGGLHVLRDQRVVADEQVDGGGREDGARAVRRGRDDECAIPAGE